MEIINKAQKYFMIFIFSLFLLPTWGISSQYIDVLKPVETIVGSLISVYLIIFVFIVLRVTDKCSTYMRKQALELSREDLINLLKSSNVHYDITSEFVVVKFCFRTETFFFSAGTKAVKTDNK